MYYYIVNPSAGDRAMDGLQSRLKAKLRTLKIDGEFSKTLEPGDARRITRTALDTGARTIVVVGGDQTVHEVIDSVHASKKPSVPIGIIPIGHSNRLAEYLGIRSWQHGCELLAARRLHSFLLININRHHFIRRAIFSPQVGVDDEPWELLAAIDSGYKLRGRISSCEVANLRLLNPHLDNQLFLQLSSPGTQSSRWQRLLRRRDEMPTLSQLHSKTLTLEFNRPTQVQLDGQRLNDTSFRIHLSDVPIRLITARRTETD